MSAPTAQPSLSRAAWGFPLLAGWASCAGRAASVERQLGSGDLAIAVRSSVLHSLRGAREHCRRRVVLVPSIGLAQCSEGSRMTLDRRGLN